MRDVATQYLLDQPPCQHLSVELFTVAECRRIEQHVRSLPREDGVVTSRGRWSVSSRTRISRVAWIDNTADTRWLFEKVAATLLALNGRVWRYSVRGVGHLQYSEYHRGGHYVWHTDVGAGPTSTRKLSFSVQLSPSRAYLGGKLQFHHGTHVVTASRKIGSCIVFPSFLLHRVTPVFWGTRVALVGWADGTNPLA